MKQLIKTLNDLADDVRAIDVANLQSDQEDGYYADLDATNTAEEAAALAARQGCGEVVRGRLTPDEALRFIGRLIEWAKEPRRQAFYTRPELAALLKVSPAKLKRLIVSGELPAADVSDGDQPRYRIADPDVQAFLEGRQAATQRPVRLEPVRQWV